MAEDSSATPDKDPLPTAQYLHEMVLYTVKAEEGREASLTGYAGMLLTSTSIISAALVAVAPAIFEAASELGSGVFRVLVVAYVLIGLLLLTSFVLILISQMRTGYQALPNPSSILEQTGDGLFDELEVAQGLCGTFDPIYKSRDCKNNRTVDLLNAATTVLFALAGLLLLSIVGFASVVFVIGPTG